MKKIAAILAFSLLAGTAQAAKMELSKTTDGQMMVYLSGDIERGDAKKLASTIESETSSGRKVTTLFLNSPGGYVSEGVMMSNIVRNYKLGTIVMDGDVCASACFIVFAAGELRTAGKKANVGVHHAYDGRTDNVTEDSATATDTMAQVSIRLGVSPEVITKMRETAPDKMAWLSVDDLRGMGVQVWSPENNQDAKASAKDDSGEAFIRMWQKPMPERNKYWTNFVDMASKSPLYAGGYSNNFYKECDKEGRCTKILGYKGRKGPMTIMEYTTRDNKLLARFTCSYTTMEMEDRICQNYDTGHLVREVKTTKGDWKTVETDAPPR